MNRSPGCVLRESVQTRMTAAAGLPLKRSPRQLSATYFKERASTLLQGKAGAHDCRDRFVQGSRVVDAFRTGLRRENRRDLKDAHPRPAELADDPAALRGDLFRPPARA